MGAIQYPLINGYRHAGNSIDALDLNGNKFRGFKVIDYTRKRNRGIVRGNHPDPIAKTRGSNDYNGSIELYLAEWNAYLASIGAGYGDFVFQVNVTYVEGPFDTITDQLIGCTIDSSSGGGDSTSGDALLRKFDLSPLKILYNGIDDCEAPLIGT